MPWVNDSGPCRWSYWFAHERGCWPGKFGFERCIRRLGFNRFGDPTTSLRLPNDETEEKGAENSACGVEAKAASY
jgi:hypothetical protein